MVKMTSSIIVHSFEIKLPPEKEIVEWHCLKQWHFVCLRCRRTLAFLYKNLCFFPKTFEVIRYVVLVLQLHFMFQNGKIQILSPWLSENSGCNPLKCRHRCIN